MQTPQTYVCAVVQMIKSSLIIITDCAIISIVIVKAILYQNDVQLVLNILHKIVYFTVAFIRVFQRYSLTL